MLFTAPAAAHLLPAPYQGSNFSGALIWSSITSDDGNNLIEQINSDKVFRARLVYLNQRSAEFIKMLESRARRLLAYCTKLTSRRAVNMCSSCVDIRDHYRQLFALHVTSPRA
jgi:hypothetical protein